MEAFLAEVNKTYKTNIMRMASEMPDLPRIPTGIFHLDAYMGGGMPMSKMMLLHGAESSGKTTIALKCAANAQKMDRETHEELVKDPDTGQYVRVASGEVGTPMNVLFIDVEGSLDRKWAEALGIDIDLMYIATPSYQEQAIDIMMGVLKTGGVDLLILDSIAAMSPATEMEASAEDQQMGLAARINNKFFRTLQGNMNALSQKGIVPPAFIAINQVREKIGVMYGSNETLPGGNQQRFSADIRVRVNAVGKPLVDPDTKEMVGVESNFSILKNKINGRREGGSYVIYVQDTGPMKKGDTDEHLQVLEWAVKLGALTQRGAYYDFPGLDKAVQGKGNAVAHLQANPEFFKNLRKQVIEAVLQ